MQIVLSVEDATRSRRDLALEATSEAHAVRLAAARGLRVLAIRSNGAAVHVPTGRRRALPLIQFTQELLALLDAGLNLNEALETLLEKETAKEATRTLQTILETLRQGKSFSTALEAHAETFPPLYLATVRANEQSGGLSEALSRWVAYELQLEQIRKKVVLASVYPLLLLGVAAFVTLFLVGYVVPRFSAVYETTGREIPWMSAALLALGRAIHANWAIVGIGAVGIGAAATALLWRPSLRQALLARIAAIPGFSQQVRVFRLSRFYRAMALLTASGVPAPKAMLMASDLLAVDQKAALQRAHNQIVAGTGLAQALDEHGLATPIARSLLRVGERSGRLSDMLERAARFHDDAFARWIDVTSRLLEPVLMAVIGLVIGVVVVLLYMPIFDLAGSLQ
jgi:general secretion pathway protein F